MSVAQWQHRFARDKDEVSQRRSAHERRHAVVQHGSDEYVPQPCCEDHRHDYACHDDRLANCGFHRAEAQERLLWVKQVRKDAG